MLPLLRAHARRQRLSVQRLVQAASTLARLQQPDGGALAVLSGRRYCELETLA
jgi:hypothetical protein